MNEPKNFDAQDMKIRIHAIAKALILDPNLLYAEYQARTKYSHMMGSDVKPFFELGILTKSVPRHYKVLGCSTEAFNSVIVSITEPGERFGNEYQQIKGAQATFENIADSERIRYIAIPPTQSQSKAQELIDSIIVNNIGYDSLTKPDNKAYLNPMYHIFDPEIQTPELTEREAEIKDDEDEEELFSHLADYIKQTEELFANTMKEGIENIIVSLFDGGFGTEEWTKARDMMKQAQVQIQKAREATREGIIKSADKTEES